MELLAQYQASPSPCSYLPREEWSLLYEHVLSLDPAEYMERMQQGWRRFGYTIFQPRCPSCRGCKSLRVPLDTFQPNRSQARAWKRNAGEVRLEIDAPSASRNKLKLYDHYHQFQAAAKGWPEHPAKDIFSYKESFVHNPFPTEEWCYYLGRKLVGVGYVDALPEGLSAIYFYYDPNERHRSLGTLNVLNILAAGRARGLPHVYLGYFVEGCESLAYKANFRPNQILDGGTWVDFLQ